jgi:hypothetical protein
MAKKAAEAMTCEQCRFCFEDRVMDCHRCRRFPPVLVIEEDGSYFRFPMVDPEKDWCGELKPPLNS